MKAAHLIDLISAVIIPVIFKIYFHPTRGRKVFLRDQPFNVSEDANAILSILINTRTQIFRVYKNIATPWLDNRICAYCTICPHN